MLRRFSVLMAAVMLVAGGCSPSESDTPNTTAPPETVATTTTTTTTALPPATTSRSPTTAATTTPLPATTQATTATERVSNPDRARTDAVWIDAGDHKLPGTFTAPMAGGGNSEYPTVLMLHGFGADKNEGGNMFGRLAEYLGVAGVASLRIDFAAAGDSEQPWIENDFDGMVADAVTALDWLSTHDSVDADRLGVHGWSVGGRVSATVAGSDDRVQTLSLWAGSVQDGTDGMEFFFEAPTRRRCGSLYECAVADGSVRFDPYGTGPFELSLAWFDTMAASQALTVVGDFDGPLLAIHGENDDVVLPSVSRNLITEFGSYDATLRVIPGGDHTFGVYVDPDNDIAEEVLIITARWIEAQL